MPTNVVEIGFDVSGSPLAPFVTLNDPVKGLLGSTEYVLGGTLFYDVTSKVLEYGINRGKSRQLDRYSAGQVQINLDNTDRTFDPLYAGSPYAGQIIPRRPVRITSNGIRQVVGSIDDWDLSYEVRGRAIATVKGSDGMTQLANQTLPALTNTVQLSGARINDILSNVQVNWDPDARTIDEGQTTLQADTVSTGANALQYIQKITDGEPGSFFIAKDGDARFKDRFGSAANGTIIFADDGTGLPYTNLRVVYGTELLYNEIISTRLSGGTATAINENSQLQYGIFNLTLDGLLMNSDTDNQNLVNLFISKFANPEYRFEALDVELDTLSEANQNTILGLELGDVVQVKFTPSGIGDPIQRNVEIIRIAQRKSPTQHIVSLGLGGIEAGFWRLSDPFFGKLSAGNTLAY
jgi:hypothetical protein